VITTCPLLGMKWGGEEIEQRDIVGSGKPQTDLPGRIDAVLELTCPGPGHRDYGDSGHTGGEHLDHQIGERCHAPVLETVHQLPGHALVFECGDEPDATVEYSLRGGSKSFPAPDAEKPPGRRVTCLTKHHLRP
jgi:hypothetical protein